MNNTSKYEGYKLPFPRTNKIENEGNINWLVTSPLHKDTKGQGKDHIITVNSEYKIRLIGTTSSNIVTDNFFIVKQTSLGPTYGKPVTKIRVVPGSDKDKRLLAFATEVKIIGLIYLPFDGNPFRMMGVIGHPRGIKEIRTSSNLDYIFTTGGNDYVINVWKHNIHPLIDAVQTSYEKGNDPHLQLLEGGKDGLMYQEMVNFFYYTQIKSKEENTTRSRTLGEYVDKTFIHGLMASMGYYPSHMDIGYMYNEIKYNRPDTEKYDKSLESLFTFEMFVKLYINHRPYKDLEYDKFNKAFKKIFEYLNTTNSLNEDDKKNKPKYENTSTILRDKLIELLKEHGEKMEEKQISECLEVLTGEPGIKSLKDNISADYFYHQILKFEEEPMAEEETKDS